MFRVSEFGIVCAHAAVVVRALSMSFACGSSLASESGLPIFAERVLVIRCLDRRGVHDGTGKPLQNYDVLWSRLRPYSLHCNRSGHCWDGYDGTGDNAVSCADHVQLKVAPGCKALLLVGPIQNIYGFPAVGEAMAPGH
jgi:hypothetical protein